MVISFKVLKINNFSNTLLKVKILYKYIWHAMLELLEPIKYFMSKYLLLVVWSHWEISHWYKDLNLNLSKGCYEIIMVGLFFFGYSQFWPVYPIISDHSIRTPRSYHIPPGVWCMSLLIIWSAHLSTWSWGTDMHCSLPNNLSYYLHGNVPCVISDRGERSHQSKDLNWNYLSRCHIDMI